MNGYHLRGKKLVIAGLVVGISLLHFAPLPGWMGAHLLHRELYFFPILLAGFWFGIAGGTTASLCISMVYVAPFAVSDMLSNVAGAIGFQVMVFIAVGLILGLMVDLQERRRKERDDVNDAFGLYVSSEVRDEILNGRISVDGEVKQVTLLFADIRDFTGLVENLEPRKVVNVLNRYFNAMTEAVRRHQGLVLQFVGDEIMVVFGAPLSNVQHAQMAVKAAVEMRSRLKLLNQD